MAHRLFIAEDNPHAVDSLVELLQALGGMDVVGTAGSELSAADWLLSRPDAWDVLITDLMLLPGGTGFGLIRHARSLGNGHKVVVFSDFVTPVVAERCKELGADAVFAKVELEQLLAYLRALDDAPAADAQNGMSSSMSSNPEAGFDAPPPAPPERGAEEAGARLGGADRRGAAS